MKDKKIQKLLQAEKKRQKSVINLIASENYVSDDVLKALGSETTNKYAEGYPGKRYYAGNEIVDKIENVKTERISSLTSEFFFELYKPTVKRKILYRLELHLVFYFS